MSIDTPPSPPTVDALLASAKGLQDNEIQALVARVVVDSLGRPWDPLKHPRDAKGRFIETFAEIRGAFRTPGGAIGEPQIAGRVVGINQDGSVLVRVDHGAGKYAGREGEYVTLQGDDIEALQTKAKIARAINDDERAKINSLAEQIEPIDANAAAALRRAADPANDNMMAQLADLHEARDLLDDNEDDAVSPKVRDLVWDLSDVLGDNPSNEENIKIAQAIIRDHLPADLTPEQRQEAVARLDAALTQAPDRPNPALTDGLDGFAAQLYRVADIQQDRFPADAVHVRNVASKVSDAAAETDPEKRDALLEEAGRAALRIKNGQMQRKFVKTIKEARGAVAARENAPAPDPNAPKARIGEPPSAAQPLPPAPAADAPRLDYTDVADRPPLPRGAERKTTFDRPEQVVGLVPPLSAGTEITVGGKKYIVQDSHSSFGGQNWVRVEGPDGVRVWSMSLAPGARPGGQQIVVDKPFEGIGDPIQPLPKADLPGAPAGTAPPTGEGYVVPDGHSIQMNMPLVGFAHTVTTGRITPRPDAHGSRRDIERGMFGDDAEPPVYGFLSDPNRPLGIAPYGNILLTLRPTRATTTMGDSIGDEGIAGRGVPVVETLNAEHRPPTETDKAPYREVQMHGGVTLDQIEKVQIPRMEGSKISADDARAVLAARAAGLGVETGVVGKDGTFVPDTDYASRSVKMDAEARRLLTDPEKAGQYEAYIKAQRDAVQGPQQQQNAPGPTLVGQLIEKAKAGGFTFDPRSKTFKSTGFAVARQGMGAEPFPADAPDGFARLAEYVTDNWNTFENDPGAFLGGWEADGLIYLDVPDVLDSLDDAIKAGTDRFEIAIADLAKYAAGEDGEIRLQYATRPPVGTPAHNDWTDLNGVRHVNEPDTAGPDAPGAGGDEGAVHTAPGEGPGGPGTGGPGDGGGWPAVDDLGNTVPEGWVPELPDNPSQHGLTKDGYAVYAKDGQYRVIPPYDPDDNWEVTVPSWAAVEAVIEEHKDFLAKRGVPTNRRANAAKMMEDLGFGQDVLDAINEGKTADEVRAALAADPRFREIYDGYKDAIAAPSLMNRRQADALALWERLQVGAMLQLEIGDIIERRPSLPKTAPEAPAAPEVPAYSGELRDVKIRDLAEVYGAARNVQAWLDDAGNRPEIYTPMPDYQPAGRGARAAEETNRQQELQDTWANFAALVRDRKFAEAQQELDRIESFHRDENMNPEFVQEHQAFIDQARGALDKIQQRGVDQPQLEIPGVAPLSPPNRVEQSRPDLNGAFQAQIENDPDTNAKMKTLIERMNELHTVLQGEGDDYALAFDAQVMDIILALDNEDYASAFDRIEALFFSQDAEKETTDGFENAEPKIGDYFGADQAYEALRDGKAAWNALMDGLGVDNPPPAPDEPAPDVPEDPEAVLAKRAKDAVAALDDQLGDYAGELYNAVIQDEQLTTFDEIRDAIVHLRERLAFDEGDQAAVDIIDNVMQEYGIPNPYKPVIDKALRGEPLASWERALLGDPEVPVPDVVPDPPKDGEPIPEERRKIDPRIRGLVEEVRRGIGLPELPDRIDIDRNGAIVRPLDLVWVPRAGNQGPQGEDVVKRPEGVAQIHRIYQKGGRTYADVIMYDPEYVDLKNRNKAKRDGGLKNNDPFWHFDVKISDIQKLADGNPEADEFLKHLGPEERRQYAGRNAGRLAQDRGRVRAEMARMADLQYIGDRLPDDMNGLPVGRGDVVTYNGKKWEVVHVGLPDAKGDVRLGLAPVGANGEVIPEKGPDGALLPGGKRAQPLARNVEFYDQPLGDRPPGVTVDELREFLARLDKAKYPVGTDLTDAMASGDLDRIRRAVDADPAIADYIADWTTYWADYRDRLLKANLAGRFDAIRPNEQEMIRKDKNDLVNIIAAREGRFLEGVGADRHIKRVVPEAGPPREYEGKRPDVLLAMNYRDVREMIQVMADTDTGDATLKELKRLHEDLGAMNLDNDDTFLKAWDLAARMEDMAAEHGIQDLVDQIGALRMAMREWKDDQNRRQAIRQGGPGNLPNIPAGRTVAPGLIREPGMSREAPPAAPEAEAVAIKRPSDIIMGDVVVVPEGHGMLLQEHPGPGRWKVEAITPPGRDGEPWAFLLGDEANPADLGKWVYLHPEVKVDVAKFDAAAAPEPERINMDAVRAHDEEFARKLVVDPGVADQFGQLQELLNDALDRDPDEELRKYIVDRIFDPFIKGNYGEGLVGLDRLIRDNPSIADVTDLDREMRDRLMDRLPAGGWVRVYNKNIRDYPGDMNEMRRDLFPRGDAAAPGGPANYAQVGFLDAAELETVAKLMDDPHAGGWDGSDADKDVWRAIYMAGPVDAAKFDDLRTRVEAWAGQDYWLVQAMDRYVGNKRPAPAAPAAPARPEPMPATVAEDLLRKGARFIGPEAKNAVRALQDGNNPDPAELDALKRDVAARLDHYDRNPGNPGRREFYQGVVDYLDGVGAGRGAAGDIVDPREAIDKVAEAFDARYDELRKDRKNNAARENAKNVNRAGDEIAELLDEANAYHADGDKDTRDTYMSRVDAAVDKIRADNPELADSVQNWAEGVRRYFAQEDLRGLLRDYFSKAQSFHDMDMPNTGERDRHLKAAQDVIDGRKETFPALAAEMQAELDRVRAQYEADDMERARAKPQGRTEALESFDEQVDALRKRLRAGGNRAAAADLVDRADAVAEALNDAEDAHKAGDTAARDAALDKARDAIPALESIDPDIAEAARQAVEGNAARFARVDGGAAGPAPDRGPDAQEMERQLDALMQHVELEKLGRAVSSGKSAAEINGMLPAGWKYDARWNVGHHMNLVRRIKTPDGRYVYLKREENEEGARSEVWYANILAQLGLPGAAPARASGVWVVTGAVGGDGIDDQGEFATVFQGKTDETVNTSGRGWVLRKVGLNDLSLADEDSAIRILLANALVGNSDRHHGNAHYGVDANGNGYLLPLDHGRLFYNNGGYASSAISGTPLDAVVGRVGNPNQFLRAFVERVRKNRTSAEQIYDQTVDRLEGAVQQVGVPTELRDELLKRLVWMRTNKRKFLEDTASALGL